MPLRAYLTLEQPDSIVGPMHPRRQYRYPDGMSSYGDTGVEQHCGSEQLTQKHMWKPLLHPRGIGDGGRFLFFRDAPAF